eukprot:1193975-Prorocentrum_minimum.AAC.2
MVYLTMVNSSLQQISARYKCSHTSSSSSHGLRGAQKLGSKGSSGLTDFQQRIPARTKTTTVAAGSRPNKDGKNVERILRYPGGIERRIRYEHHALTNTNTKTETRRFFAPVVSVVFGSVRVCS